MSKFERILRVITIILLLVGLIGYAVRGTHPSNWVLYFMLIAIYTETSVLNVLRNPTIDVRIEYEAEEIEDK